MNMRAYYVLHFYYTYAGCMAMDVFGTLCRMHKFNGRIERTWYYIHACMHARMLSFDFVLFSAFAIDIIFIIMKFIMLFSNS